MIKKFIGEDGSLGLEKNAVYEVFLNKDINNKYMAFIKLNKNKIIYCPYSSIKMFNKNWR